jgi:hypothetical protein
MELFKKFKKKSYDLSFGRLTYNRRMATNSESFTYLFDVRKICWMRKSYERPYNLIEERWV